MGIQGSSMHEGNKGYPVAQVKQHFLWWLWEECVTTQCMALCCGDAYDDPIHRPKHLQWARGRPNRTLKKAVWSDESRFLLNHPDSWIHVCCIPWSTSRLSTRTITFHALHVTLGKYHQETSVSFHCYADDTQLYISLQPVETTPHTLVRNGLKYIMKTSRFCPGLQAPQIVIQWSIFGMYWTNKFHQWWLHIGV